MLALPFGRLALVTFVGLLAGCDSNPISSIKESLPTIPGITPEQTVDLPKVTPDSDIPIILSSNKQDTTFTVNGVTLDKAKFMKVLVPKTDLRITARAPCYRLKEQTTGPDGFGPSSQFNFLFSNWDRNTENRTKGCT